MNILITGGTGFVGKKLGAQLVSQNHRVFILVRDKKKYDSVEFASTFLDWNDLTDIIKNKKIEIDSVINLAGEPIAQRWNDKVKQNILNSRVDTTNRLVRVFKDSPLKVFVSASAIGYYGDQEDELVSEDSESGTGFLSRVCVQWEKAAQKMQESVPRSRTVILRFGMVLGKEGGALPKMILPFKHGLGGTIGDGSMWVSWIHIDDLLSLIIESIENKSYEGIYNAVAPNPVTNKEFSEKLAATFDKKLFLPVPKTALKFALGEMSQVLTASQRVENKHAREAGFTYKHPEISNAFRSMGL